MLEFLAGAFVGFVAGLFVAFVVSVNKDKIEAKVTEKVTLK